jgi:hypothetical protein
MWVAALLRNMRGGPRNTLLRIFFLNLLCQVHEGPVRVAMSGSDGKLKPGMFFSDEPGYYQVLYF